MQGIYKITNKNNGKVYIGQATNLEERLSEHKQKRFVPIDMWINVLGVENFDFEILEECALDELDQKEQDYIKLYDSKKNGYNKQDGGYNNSIGEGNGRARLTLKDVIKIRQAYNNHEIPKQFYENNFKDQISFSQFQAVWQGRSWGSVMPEVFTEENKKFYISGMQKQTTSLTREEVLKYRKYYINHSAEQVYKKMIKEKGEILKFSTFQKILCGDVKQNSIYNDIPVYKKNKKQWELNNEPVSTIPESGEQGCY